MRWRRHRPLPRPRRLIKIRVIDYRTQIFHTTLQYYTRGQKHYLAVVSAVHKREEEKEEGLNGAKSLVRVSSKGSIILSSRKQFFVIVCHQHHPPLGGNKRRGVLCVRRQVTDIYLWGRLVSRDDTEFTGDLG